MTGRPLYFLRCLSRQLVKKPVLGTDAKPTFSIAEWLLEAFCYTFVLIFDVRGSKAGDEIEFEMREKEVCTSRPERKRLSDGEVSILASDVHPPNGVFSLKLHVVIFL